MNRQAHARQLERPEGQLSENAKRVLNARYLRRDSAGNVIESPREMFERVARAVSQAELMFASSDISQYWEERFRALLCSLDFLPNSPTLMNAGTLLGQLSACFVLPIEDNLQSIFRALGDMAQIQRSGGGTGFAFSHLRAAGERLSSSGGTSSGPVSFMEIFDSATENIKLGGRRRGANMAVLRINHPDIEAFIDCKRDGSLRNFNLSIAITDEFMQSVDKGEMHSLRARDGREVKTVRARDLFNRICDAAWNSGDPGLLFIDTINRQNPVITDGAIESTNPCGEVPLLPYESCNLGSINLSHFVTSKQGRASIDFELLRATVHDSVRFLDDVITVNRYPLAEVERATLESRKIDLGVMGFAEVCILLGIPYTSEFALQLAEQVMQFVSSEARHASMCLATERDTFLAWPRSTFASTGLRLRNATLTSIAPTGTLSLIAGTSSGIVTAMLEC